MNEGTIALVYNAAVATGIDGPEPFIALLSKAKT